MGITINGVLDVRWPTLLDQRSGKLLGSVTLPYDTKAQALASIPSYYRSEGLVVYVRNSTDANKVDWYQFQGGKLDIHLIKIDFSGGGSGTTITGTIVAPGGTIELPTGALYQYMTLDGVGLVSVGWTAYDEDEINDGREIINTVTLVEDVLYSALLMKKSKTDVTLFVTCENDVDYEIFAI